MIFAMVSLAVTQGVLAMELRPYSVNLNCDPAKTMGNPQLQPSNGKSQVQLHYLGNEEFCYRIKFQCDREFSGTIDVGCFCEDDPGGNPADGGVGFGGFIDSGDGFCSLGAGHVRNNEFSHSCSFGNGDVRFRVEAVNGKFCSDLPAVNNCLFDNGSPGCDCPECEELVCGIDPFCCGENGGRWDGFCADLAIQNDCQAMCQ
jgi:hypothetical protein